MKIKKQFDATLNNERGMVLVVVLLLTAALIILGTTAVMQTSTDLKIGSNYRTGEGAFYAAEAGIEEARARLRQNATYPINDGHPSSDQWSAYIGTDTKAQGKGYDNTNAMHVKVDRLLSDLDYVVRVRHQTDASGNILYWGDPDNNETNERNTTTGQNIYLVSSYGYSGTSAKTVTVEITRVPPVNVPSGLYVKAPTYIKGSSTSVIGINSCGSVDKPGILTTGDPGSVTLNGNPTITGNPDIVYNGAGINVQAVVDSLKNNADFSYTVDSETHTGTQVPGPGDGWGIPTPGATQQDPSSCSTGSIVYYDTQDTDIKFSGDTTGCGILLVDGDLELTGGFSWYGIIIATGSIRFTGGGDKNITGAIMSGASVDADLDADVFIAGNANIIYCSSAIDDQTQNMPLKILSWIEEM